MNLQMEILIVLSAFGLVSFIACAWGLRNLFRLKALAESNNELIFHLEKALSEHETELAASRRLIDRQTRRIDRLENQTSRAAETAAAVAASAGSVPVGKFSGDKPHFSETARMSRVEQKHKILRLAEHGQNPRTIAETLGLMPGEVELIVKLNRPQFA